MKRQLPVFLSIFLGFVLILPSVSSWAAGALKVTTPNGGEKWTSGKKYTIKWINRDAGTYAKIQLLRSGKHYRWIARKTKNDGGHAQGITKSLAKGSSYKRKNITVKNKKITDTSNKAFTILSDSSNFDLDQVTWLHTKVAKWPQTSTLKVTLKGNSVCLAFKESKSWPSISIVHTSGKYRIKVNANPWVFVKRGGRWYGGTWEWFVPGKVCKNKSAVAGDHIKVSPLTNWRPKSGETLYFMVSALARSGKKNNFAYSTQS